MRSKGVDLGLKSTSIQKWCTDNKDNNLPCCLAFDNHDLLASANFKQGRGFFTVTASNKYGRREHRSLTNISQGMFSQKNFDITLVWCTKGTAHSSVPNDKEAVAEL